MRIISQNRDLSINFDRSDIEISENEILWIDGSKYRRLGIYESPERAREVFYDVHDAYAPVYSISSGMTPEEVAELFIKSPNISSNNIVGFDGEASVTIFSECVYYMPAE